MAPVVKSYAKVPVAGYALGKGMRLCPKDIIPILVKGSQLPSRSLKTKREIKKILLDDLESWTLVDLIRDRETVVDLRSCQRALVEYSMN